MDWNKAKTILIIAFVILDIFLVSQVISIRNSSTPSTSFEMIKERLSEKGIEVAIDVVGEELSLALLEVEYMTYDGESKEINEFLGESVNELIENEYYVNDSGQSIQIKQGKKLTFLARDIESYAESNLNDEAEQIASFSRQYNINLDGFIRIGSYMVDNINNILYKETYQGYTIENSYYKFIQDGSGLVGFEMQRIRNLRETQANIELSKPEEALLRLLKFNDIKSESVIGMDICYYRDEELIDWGEIVVDNLEPTWKVLFESGIVKYLLEFE